MPTLRPGVDFLHHPSVIVEKVKVNLHLEVAPVERKVAPVKKVAKKVAKKAGKTTYNSGWKYIQSRGILKWISASKVVN